MHVRPIEQPLHPKMIQALIVYGLRWPRPTFISVPCVLTIPFSPCISVAFIPRAVFEYSYIWILLQRRPGR